MTENSSNDLTWHTQIANWSNKSHYSWLYNNTSSCIEYGCEMTNTDDDEYFTSGYWRGSTRIGHNYGAPNLINYTGSNNNGSAAPDAFSGLMLDWVFDL